MPSDNLAAANESERRAVLSVRAAARRLRMSRRQTDLAAVDGRLIALSFGGRRFITTASVLALERQLSVIPGFDALC